MEYPITTQNPEVVVCIHKFVNSFLSYRDARKYSSIILKAVEGDPQCVLAHCYAAFYGLLTEDANITKQSLAKAQKIVDSNRQKLTQREIWWNEVFQNLITGHLRIVVDTLEKIVEEYPRDIFAGKFLTLLLFDHGKSKDMLKVSEKIFKHNPETSYSHGMLAFALVENWQAERAEVIGKAGSNIINKESHPDGDPWCHHAVAHSFDITGRVEEGIKWMEGKSSAWEDCNEFIYSHNWWHYALFYFDADLPDIAMKIFENNVWNRAKSNAQEQLNAISLLWRLEIEGGDEKQNNQKYRKYWDQIVEYIKTRENMHTDPFLDCHYAYALARIEDGSRFEDFRTGVIENSEKKLQADESHWFYNDRFSKVAVPIVEAIKYNHVEKDYEKSFGYSQSVVQNWRDIGGSNSQRDLFKQMHDDILLKTARYEDAKDSTEQSLQQKRNRIPRLLRNLSEAYKGMGDGEASKKATESAKFYSQMFKDKFGQSE